MNVIIEAKNITSTVAAICLLFFLGGCADGFGQVGVMTKCRQAEVTVDAAKKEYDQAILELSNNPKNEALKKAIPAKTQALLDSQENAFDKCYRIR